VIAVHKAQWLLYIRHSDCCTYGTVIAVHKAQWLLYISHSDCCTYRWRYCRDSFLLLLTVLNAFCMIFKISNGPLTRFRQLVAGFLPRRREFWCQASLCGIYGGQSGTETYPPPRLFRVSHFSIIPPMLRVHLLSSSLCCFISEIDSVARSKTANNEQRIFINFLTFRRNTLPSFLSPNLRS
jgi:hypothetical protein